jgi:two-component system response regulator VicR
MNKILVVEDDRNLLETVKYNLLKEGYDTRVATDVAEALDIARQQKPDLIILDIMLPKIDGFEVCRILRKEMKGPIIMLTARVDETNRIIGLDTGTDDYITKPFSVRELLARVRASLRRTKMSQTSDSEESEILSLKNITVDLHRHRVTVNGKPLELSANYNRVKTC